MSHDVYSASVGDLVADEGNERRSRLMSLAVAAFGAGLLASSVGLLFMTNTSVGNGLDSIPVLVAYGGLASQGAGFLIAGMLLHRMASERARLALEREGILEEISQALERVNDRLERAERSYREHERRLERQAESRILGRILDHEERLSAIEHDRPEPGLVRLTPSARARPSHREEQAEGS